MTPIDTQVVARASSPICGSIRTESMLPVLKNRGDTWSGYVCVLQDLSIMPCLLVDENSNILDALLLAILSCAKSTRIALKPWATKVTWVCFNSLCLFCFNTMENLIAIVVALFKRPDRARLTTFT